MTKGHLWGIILCGRNPSRKEVCYINDIDKLMSILYDENVLIFDGNLGSYIIINNKEDIPTNLNEVYFNTNSKGYLFLAFTQTQKKLVNSRFNFKVRYDIQQPKFGQLAVSMRLKCPKLYEYWKANR